MPPKGPPTPRKGGQAAAPSTTRAAAAQAPPPSSSTPASRRSTIPEPQAPPPGPPNSPILLAPLTLFILVIGYLAIFFHYQLPTPISALDNAASERAGKGPLFSEGKAMDIISKLSVDIGYRIVGTKQHVDAEEWLLEEVRNYEGLHHLGGGAGDVQVEVWQQLGDGAHRFDFMSSVVWKKYYDMSNIIVRISDGTDESKKNSLLVNSHLDSTLPSPGAADDGAGVGIMVELLRIFTTPSPTRGRLRNSVVLLFNNGEESLQDASHLYITSNHTTVPSIRSVVNLEACGTSGPELLFQAASTEMIKAYSKVPYPFGTVLANDVFSSGIIMSDTDYRQFVEYSNGKVVGLDMAIVGDSYLYHTRKDTPDYIQPGVVQHFGENVLAIVDYLLTSPESTLASTGPTPKHEAPIYFSLLGRFFISIPAKIFRGMSMGLSAFVNFQLQSVCRADTHFGALKATVISVLGALASLIGAILASNVQALIMTRVLDSSLSWFTHAWLPIPLYAPAAIIGMLLGQKVTAQLIKKEDRPYLERASLNGLLLVFVLILLLMNAFAIGSAYLFVLGAGGILFGLLVNDFALIGWGQLELKKIPINKRVHPATYFIVALTPAVVGAEGMGAFLDLFVPLTGRAGSISPADHIIATIVSVLSFLSLPWLLPLAHRFDSQVTRRIILFFLSVSITALALYSSSEMKPFDELHPKRLFVHQTHNLTSGEWYLNLGGADPAPESIFQTLADGLQEEFGIKGEAATLVDMTEYNTDWDIVYPVSRFITPYKFRTEAPQGLDSISNTLSRWLSSSSSSSSQEEGFKVQSLDDTLNLSEGTRTFTIQIHHKDIIWSVLAFDAHILEWDLPVAVPSGGYQRHHIKEVSRFGKNVWSVRIKIKLQEEELEILRRDESSATEEERPFSHLFSTDPTNKEDSIHEQYRSTSLSARRLLIDYSGLWGAAMWPLAERSTDPAVIESGAVQRFKAMDEWLKEKHPEVDAMLLNVVAGVVAV